MKYTLTWSMLLLLAFLLSCNSDETTSNTTEFETLIIAKGNLYGLGSEGFSQENIIIQNDAEWEALLLQIDSGNNISVGFLESEIDFSEFVVLASFDKLRSLSGFSLELDINQSNNQIIVNVINVSEHENGLGSLVENQPFIIVKVPVTNLPIFFN